MLSRFEVIKQRTKEIYPENTKQYPWRTAFELAVEQAFNEKGAGTKFEREILRSAISDTFGPKHFPEGLATPENIAQCARVLARYGFGTMLESINEALRQYRVEDFSTKISLRKSAGEILGTISGYGAKKRAREHARPRPTEKQLPLNIQ